MKLPSSSSLLLASLAVSASSSSSLSALAAPAGDLPEDSSSPAPVAHCKDGAVTRSLDHLQSRGMIGDTIRKALNPVEDLVRKELPVIGKLLGRDSESATDPSPQSPPAAPPSTPAPAAEAAPTPPVKPPVDPSDLPVKPPVEAPKPPVNPAAKSIERRGSVGNLVNGIPLPLP